MKRLLVGTAALAAAFVLAACSGGGAQPGGNAAAPAAPAMTSRPPASTVTVPTPTTTQATTTQPAPTTTTKPAPKPKPKAEPASDAPSVPCAAAAAASGTSACMDLSAHKAWLLRDGKVIYGPVGALGGRKSNPTPIGTFHVIGKERMHLSTEFDNAPMPFSVFFYPGDAFHTGSLATPSHGCIHLSSGASQTFFNTLHLGDVVQVVS